ncbi:ABC-type branched-subunit amino acid transport system ATPase component [Thermocatellispora tengchongensis]|uniref:ABC-type branched-subunit amino acid transport system ATPase component n=1 Tax=Thermocatellispora tengchongensis TaxID=1073253 RepID=A0A840PIW2_9ACTN|nr:ATP-binding cassette domain-containing protein [Thermocatellispora tengchongensis]MBB5137853.1 ABC-type branched-subunit amino acid transport system ATPase component [Thermocatellispora tengchongensis]
MQEDHVFNGDGREAPELIVRGLTKRFGGVTAVDDVGFRLPGGQALAVVGPNGAGKSTLLKLLAGAHTPTSGSIEFGGRRLERASARQVVRAGIALAHQIPRPFTGLTVWENVAIGAGARGRAAEEHIAAVIAECGLQDKMRRRAENLRLLDLKRLELARALSTRPRCILLDEVAAGLSGRELDEVIALIARISATGCGLVLVEHVEGVVQSLVDRVIVMDWGRIIAEGTPAQIAADATVRQVYLGDGARPRTAARETPPARSGPPLLRLEGVDLAYGDIPALRGVDLEVWPGEVVAVLGANGAGKSSLAAAISGAERVRSGSVRFGADDVTALPAYRRARRGIAHCPEGRRVFPALSVEENLKLALPLRMPAKEVAGRLEDVYAVFPALAEMRARRGGALSGGQQQMLAIGRALIGRPRLVVLDEISLGLAPVVIDGLYEAIEAIRSEGIAVVVVEQNVHRCLAVADRAYVLDRGVVSYAGDPAPLSDPRLLERLYFGSPREEALSP